MRHGSLESGIGGFDYASDVIGWENVFHCEINPFCRTVLNHYWPKAKSYANVFGFNGYEWRRKVDIITCGFPCQPFSHAGKRKGSSDDRHIWPENYRIIKEAQPAYVVAENVPGLLTIERGVVFEQVCADLEAEGYEVTPFIIPACATDKDHRRDRLWIVAYSKSFRERPGAEIKGSDAGGRQQLEGTEQGRYIDYAFNGFTTNPDNGRQAEQEQQAAGDKQCNRQYEFTTNSMRIGQPGRGKHRRPCNSKENADRQIHRTVNGNQLKESWLEAATRLCALDDGLSGGLDTATISKSKWRIESLKAAGNAIVWEIAYEIFEAIKLTDIKP